MKEKLNLYRKFSFVFSYILILFIIISTGNNQQAVITNNANMAKSIQAMYFVQNYETDDPTENTTLYYDNFNDAITTISTTGQAVSFNGTLTGYGPDCKGCSGGVACPPGKNVMNGNIYYNDSTYGTLRIVAADRNIPCGSIIRLNNINIYNEPIIAIVMDRGSSVKTNHIDLLFETERNMQGFSTQKNVQFDILRWGF